MRATKPEVNKVDPPKRKDIITIRILISCGLIAMAAFLFWFIDADHMGYAPIFWLLTFALGFKLLKMAHEWYHYWSPGVPTPPAVTRKWTVDVLTTACPGEPKEMIINTLRAMQAIEYPHTSYLCDEGDDPELKKVCEELGVVHVTRKIKVDAKAGNINNALRQATGEICVVLDPDHVPVPQFLHRVLPYFEDESVGYVQCVQAYGNQDESFVARGAAEQTYHFYGPMMMCMNTYGTAQAIGANCTFRRSALDSIGGHAAGLSEDMHTAMQLHAKGWKSVYIPEILTRGLVPATVSAYYKQQLKWSRGTFELLFRVYPRLFKHFTWRQKIHYFTLPLYFLFGLINLVDIVVPIAALCLAEVPWELDLSKFGAYFLSLCGLSLIIRLFAQRWLLEPHERGFHLHGGILRTATWWIFLTGFIYAIFNIRVPYIPTPKGDEPENAVRLSVPNLIVIFITAVLIPFGLWYDYTPYSIAMSCYSVITGAILAVTVIASQQKLLLRIRAAIQERTAIANSVDVIALFAGRCQQNIYQIFRNGTAMMIAAPSLLLLGYTAGNDASGDSQEQRKEIGGFYLGATGKVSEDTQTALFPASVEVGHPNGFQDVLKIAVAQRKMPYVEWCIAAPSAAAKTCSLIAAGRLDSYLKSCAAQFREYREPLFLSFAPAGDGFIPAGTFVEAWQYLYTFFNESGISNITWVWVPSNSASHAWYPGEKFTDWIGTRIEGSKDRSFAELYAPFRNAYGQFQKPVLITRFAPPHSPEWLDEAIGALLDDFREINGVISTEQAGYIASSGLKIFVNTAYEHTPQRIAYQSPFIKGKPGSYTLQVNGKPVYIRGVAYNTAHDWRDGNMPLSRRQVEADLAKIKAMGANTIRRYGTGVYDHNVLNIAAESGMQVMVGFWFDPHVDYFSDHEKVDEYFQEVEETVERYKSHPAVLAWGVGNETWGLLKHNFARPYLVKVRHAYLRMIEQMAQRIHEIDPSRPVVSCIEHESVQIAGELVAFRDIVPSVDVIGVNSYYREQISTLNRIAWQFDSLRPYLVSEFGPRGYWDPKFNRTQSGSVLEQDDAEKSRWYSFQWKNYVEAFKGYNVGGIAYCWHDRMEGSLTWFGLTDFMGRMKPSYFALRETWTGTAKTELPAVSIQSPQNLLPGKSYTITASVSNSCAGYSYEWKLLKDEYLEQIDNVEILDNPLTVRVTVPEKASNYRLYLFVSDARNEHVSTLSTPIMVRGRRN